MAKLFTLFLVCFQVMLAIGARRPCAPTPDRLWNSRFNYSPDSLSVGNEPVGYFQRNILTKFGLSLPLLRQSSFNGTYITLAVDATLEHRLGRKFSLLLGAENNYGYALDGHATKLYSLEVPLAVRFYYAANRRIRLHKSRNQFSSPYISFQTQNTLYSRLWYDPIQNSLGFPPDHSPNYFYADSGTQGMLGQRFDLLQYVYFQWGFQKRIGKENYVDFNVLIPLPNTAKHEYTLATPAWINLRFGIAKWTF